MTNNSRDNDPQPHSSLPVGVIVWDHPDGDGYDCAALCCDADTGQQWGIDCQPELGGDQFCAAAYLASLECGLEYWPEANMPSLCPAHWQLLLDRSAAEDPQHTLQHANAQAVILYQVVRNQMRRAARKSARGERGF